MKQLRIKDIFQLINGLSKRGMSLEEIKALPIYIGDDEELNGIHTAYFCEQIADDEANSEYIELINRNCFNLKCSGKAILIS